MFLLNNLVTWQHDEGALRQQTVEYLDECAHIVQVSSGENLSLFLLHGKQGNLCIINKLLHGCTSRQLSLIQFLGCLFVCWIL